MYRRPPEATTSGVPVKKGSLTLCVGVFVVTICRNLLPGLKHAFVRQRSSSQTTPIQRNCSGFLICGSRLGLNLPHCMAGTFACVLWQYVCIQEAIFDGPCLHQAGAIRCSALICHGIIEQICLHLKRHPLLLTLGWALLSSSDGATLPSLGRQSTYLSLAMTRDKATLDFYMACRPKGFGCKDEHWTVEVKSF